MHPNLLIIAGALTLLVSSLNAREPIPQTQLWDLDHLGNAPQTTWGETTGLVQEVYYRGEPFKGNPTRVFAYVGRPVGQGPFPGVVLVHGGGGQAFKDWANHWAERGYVSIAMDTAGNGPGKKRLADAGPNQLDTIKFQNFDLATARDQWTYHAVADVVLAHSLLRSLPEVDPDRTALTGISWGGYLTCITAGVDPRFKAAVPVYGCGFLHDNSVWADNGSFARLDDISRRLWIRHFDPGQHIARTTCPVLFLNGTNDFAYPLDSYRKTIEQVRPGLTTVAVHHNLRHGHIWSFEIVDTFISSILKKEPPLARIGETRITNNRATAPVLNDTPTTTGQIWFTRDTGQWQQRKWSASPATIVDGKISAGLPDHRPLTFFLQATDTRGLKTSTTHTTLTANPTPENHATVPTPKLEQDFYDWHQRHAEILRIKHDVDPDIVLIGDSITHMWGGLPAEPDHSNGGKTWLKSFDHRALNLGFGWDRTQNVLWRIDHGELDGLTPKLVVIHIGTNNLAGTKNHQAGTPAEIAAGIRAITKRVRTRFPDTKIVLMSVFPRGATPGHPMRQPTNGINALLPAIAKQLDATFLDISNDLLSADGTYPKSNAQDALHPTAQGYQIWANALKPHLPSP